MSKLRFIKPDSDVFPNQTFNIKHPKNTFFTVVNILFISVTFARYTRVIYNAFMKTLAQAKLHKRTTITGITESALKPKLLEMGLYSGKVVSILFKAPFGDPIAVDVDGYVLSMRLNEANLVQIEEITE